MKPETRELLERASTATLTSQLLHRGFRNTFLSGLIPTRADFRMVGTAFTLRYAPAREDMGISVDYDNGTDIQRLAVEAIGPGQILVIDARQDTRAASFGHIIATRIMHRGATGLVTDGAIRDSNRFQDLDLPTYCRAAHATTSSVIHHPVDMNVPIGCAGVLIMPGDVLVGDAEGVVVIPAAISDDVARDACEQEELEAFIWDKVNAGSSIRGVYPPNDQLRAEFARWQTTGGGGSR